MMVRRSLKQHALQGRQVTRTAEVIERSVETSSPAYGVAEHVWPRASPNHRRVDTGTSGHDRDVDRR